ALHREVLEETGYRIRVTARIGAFRQYNYMPEYSIWAEKICHVYLATPGPRVGPPTEDGHIALWMPLEEALDHVPNEGGTQFLRSRRARQLL
ncbi:MAG: NUDIX domain-containing protein, partial [Pseudomonadota bacterium]